MFFNRAYLIVDVQPAFKKIPTLTHAHSLTQNTNTRNAVPKRKQLLLSTDGEWVSQQYAHPSARRISRGGRGMCLYFLWFRLFTSGPSHKNRAQLVADTISGFQMRASIMCSCVLLQIGGYFDSTHLNKKQACSACRF